jgi:hypothetical protein
MLLSHLPAVVSAWLSQIVGVRRPGRREPLPTYGKDKIDLAQRAGQKRGWRQVE